MPDTALPRPLRIALWVTAVALGVNLVLATLVALEVGAASELSFARQLLMWCIVPPVAIALVRLGALHHAVGRWHVLAMALCALGDGLGALTDSTPVLLGLFLAGHLAYVLALWPSRRSSLAWGPGAIAFGAVALIGGGVIAAGAGPLAAPVLVYGLLLAAVAALAALDVPGLFGGLAFMLSDLVLGLGLFVLEIPDPLRSIVVLLPYTAAQALLAVSLQRRLRLTGSTSTS